MKHFHCEPTRQCANASADLGGPFRRAQQLSWHDTSPGLRVRSRFGCGRVSARSRPSPAQRERISRALINRGVHLTDTKQTDFPGTKQTAPGRDSCDAPTLAQRANTAPETEAGGWEGPPGYTPGALPPPPTTLPPRITQSLKHTKHVRRRTRQGLLPAGAFLPSDPALHPPKGRADGAHKPACVCMWCPGSGGGCAM